jgi:8-oxo-dGTP diphosphatase
MELKLFVATKAFIERDGKVLLLRESAKYHDGTNIGKYAEVGGRITPGEHLEEALRREVKEEIGLDVEIGAPFFVNETLPRPTVRGEEWQVIKVFFACKSPAGEIKLSDDHDDYLWLDPADYRDPKVIANLHPVFEAYLKARH